MPVAAFGRRRTLDLDEVPVRLPAALVAEQHICKHHQFAHHGDDRHLVGLASLPEPLKETFQLRMASSITTP